MGDTLFTEKGLEALNFGGLKTDRKNRFCAFLTSETMGLMDRIVKCCRRVFLGGDKEDHQGLFGHLFANVICQCCQAQDLHSVCNECNQLLQNFSYSHTL